MYTTDNNKSGYSWFVPGGTITAGLGSSSVTVTWNTPGTHGVTVTYTDANGCTGTSPIYNVTVNALPQPLISGLASPCESVPGNIYSTAAGMSNYNWSISAGGTISSGQGTNSILVKWNTQGVNTLSVTYTDVNACAAPVPGLLAIDVHPYPVANAGTDDYICSDVPVYTFNGSSGQYYNLANVHWDFYGVGYPSGGSLNDATLLHPTFTPAGSDLTQVNRVVMFVMTLEGTGSCAGMYDKDTVLLRIDPIPVANAGPNGETCGRQPYQLNASTALYQSSIVWSTSGNGTFNDKFIPNPSYTPGTTDVGNIIQLTMSLEGCKNLPNSSSMWLTVHPYPGANISSSEAICEGTSATVNIHLSGTPPWNITYTDGLIPVSVTNILASPYSFTIFPTSNVVYWLSAADDNFCTAPADSLKGFAEITVHSLPRIYNVTGSNNGFFCASDSGVVIGLDNSELGMTYQMLRNNLNIGLTLPGTGLPLRFGLFTTVGQYSILANNPAANCFRMMHDTI
ncbi:MAG: hypothetical protein WCK63_19205, partial [Betaproteobacteria bacterium]